MKQGWLCGVVIGFLSFGGFLLGAEKKPESGIGLSRNGHNSLRVHHGGKHHEIKIEKAEGQHVVIKCLQEGGTLTILVGLEEDPKNRGGLIHQARDPKGKRTVPHGTSMTLLAAPPPARHDQRPAVSEVQGAYAKLELPEQTLRTAQPKRKEEIDVVYTEVEFPSLQPITSQVFDTASAEAYNELVGGKIGVRKVSEVLAQPGKAYKMEDLPESNWRDSSCCCCCVSTANLCRLLGLLTSCGSETGTHILCYPCEVCAGDD